MFNLASVFRCIFMSHSLLHSCKPDSFLPVSMQEALPVMQSPSVVVRSFLPMSVFELHTRHLFIISVQAFVYTCLSLHLLITHAVSECLSLRNIMLEYSI